MAEFERGGVKFSTGPAHVYRVAASGEQTGRQYVYEVTALASDATNAEAITMAFARHGELYRAGDVPEYLDIRTAMVS